MNDVLPRRQSKRATIAWALWDWAEQPYPTLMQTFIFPVYLVQTVGAAVKNPDVWISASMIIAGISLALIAPIMGRRSDKNGRRKFWLLINTAVLALVTALSFFVEPKVEFFVFGLVLYALGSIIQEAAFINYYAMIKSVAKESNIGRISGYAWGLGYIGGILLLVISLFGFIQPDTPLFGIPKDNALNIRLIFVFAAAWILIFSLPLLFWTKEISKIDGAKKESILESYKALIRQLKSLYREAPETFKFLISSAVYRDGLAGVFTYGAIIGQIAFGFEFEEIVMYAIAANVVAAIGAAIGGRMDDKIGSHKLIVISLIGLLFGAAAIFILYPLGQITFWIFGLMLTLFVGPAQAASRTFVSRFTPEGREGEVFGLYQTTGRALSFLSHITYGSAVLLANFIFGGEENSIYGIWGIALVLGVGLWLLLKVSPKPQVIKN